MLKITIPGIEYYDEEKEEFRMSKKTTLQLEHSLVSVAKWEAKWKKPYLSKHDKTVEEIVDYIRCMTITQNVDPTLYPLIPSEQLERIRAYIDDPMTATTISNRNPRKSREVMTAEIIYYQMVSLNIPFECQKWHLNRLLTLINVCNIKNGPNKKMSKREIMRQNAALNAARRSRLGSRG